jgi:hypothetical protein
MSKHNIEKTDGKLHDFRLTMKEIVKSKNCEFGKENLYISTEPNDKNTRNLKGVDN